MSSNPTVLSYRFFNFHKKNQFLKIVQQKWFEIMSDNQTILNATTKWWMSWGTIDNNSYSIKTTTENLVAYDLNIKKILDDEDRKCIDTLAEYINWHAIYPTWWVAIFWYILFFFIDVIFVGAFDLEKLIWTNLTTLIFLLLFLPSGILFYQFFSKRAKKRNTDIEKEYKTKLKTYLEWIIY